MGKLTSRNVCCIWNAVRRLQVEKQKGTNRLFNATRHCFTRQTSQNQHREIMKFMFTNESFEDGISCSYDDDSTRYRNNTASQVFLAVWAVMIIITVLGNTLLIAAILKSKSLRRTVANLFVLSLSASDLCVGLFVLPFKLNQGINDMRFTLGINWCRVYITADHTFFVIAITHLLAISLDRYIALIYPYRYPSLIMKPWYKRSIATIWIYGFLWGSITTFSMVNEDSTKTIKVDQEICIVTMRKYYVVAVFVLVFFIPVVIMGYIYVNVLMIARRHAIAIRAVSKSFLHDSPHVKPKVKMIHNQNHHHRHQHQHDLPVGEQLLRVPSPSGFQSPLLAVRNKQIRSSFNGHIPSSRTSSSGSNHTKSPMQEYRKTIFKASKTIVVVYGTFVVAWTPVCMITLILSLCRHCLATTSNSSKWHYNLFIEVFPFMSSMLNPFIYGVMNKQYRRAFRSILESYHVLKPRHGSLSNKDHLSGSPYNSSVL